MASRAKALNAFYGGPVWKAHRDDEYQADAVIVATGASDEEVDRRIRENATQGDEGAIIKWNNEMRCLRLCDLSDQVQEYFETYIPQFCHPPSKVKFFFDVYDVEEGVL